MKYDYDFIIVGGGSGGLSALKTALGFQKKVLVIESRKLGGECTWTGCVPSKALIRAAHALWEARNLGTFQNQPGAAGIPPGWDSLRVLDYVREVQQKIYADESPEALARWGADFLQSPARVTGPHSVQAQGREYTAKALILATGSRNAAPPLPGLEDTGYLTHENLFSLTRWPESLTILGAGPLGVEMAQALNRLGTRITLIEQAPEILPREDREMAALLRKNLEEEGVRVLRGARVTQTGRRGETVFCRYEQGGLSEEVTSENLFLSLGRRPNVENLGLEEVGVKTTPQGITVDKHLRTSIKSISAVGDCTGIYPLSHNAGHQGVTAVLDRLLPWRAQADYGQMLWVTFSDPELAHLGLTEEEARARCGDSLQVVTLDLGLLDRARCDSARGLAKWLLDRRGRVVGAHILGPRAGELIHETQVLKKLGQPFTRLQGILHAYPTYSDIHRQGARKALVDKLMGHPLVKWWRKGREPS